MKRHVTAVILGITLAVAAVLGMGCSANLKSACVGYARSVGEQSHSARGLLGACHDGNEAACTQIATTLSTMETVAQSIASGAEPPPAQ